MVLVSVDSHTAIKAYLTSPIYLRFYVGDFDKDGSFITSKKKKKRETLEIRE